jgi:hypothetical protein
MSTRPIDLRRELINLKREPIKLMRGPIKLMRGPIELMRGPINQAVNEANQTGHRGHGGTIRGNQRQSEAIRGNQYSLEAFRPCLAKHVEDRRWPCIQDKSTRTRIPEMTAILKLAPMATKAGGADATAVPADTAQKLFTEQSPLP